MPVHETFVFIQGWLGSSLFPPLTRQLASNSEIPCGFWPERAIPRTNPSPHLISYHGLDLSFSASLIWNLITLPFFPWWKDNQKASEKVKYPLIKGGLQKLWSVLCIKILI